MCEPTKEQVALAEQLQQLLLEDFLRLAKDGGLKPTDRRTLYQMLKDGGWSLDPSRLPSDLRSKLKQAVSIPSTPSEDLSWEDEEDEEI